MRRAIALAMLATLAVAGGARAQAREGDFEGSVELLYRNVSQDGSTRKYDEDFDGLESGTRLSSLSANWNDIDAKLVDYLRLEAGGLGGDPYERTVFRMGRKDAYDLRLGHQKQTSLYNLFRLEDDQDASTWDTERSIDDVSLTLHVSDAIDLFFEFRQVQRDGSSLFLKNVNTDLFQLETPLDQQVKRYSIGGRFELGRADLLFRQTLRRYDYQFDNTTAGDAGLDRTDLVTLDRYQWLQSDRGGADLTTLTVSVPLGERVDLTATLFGTLLDDETVSSSVSVTADGTSFGGTCSVTGNPCDPDNPCDPGVPGDVCVADPFLVTDGASRAEIDADHLSLDVDVSVKIVDFVDFHFQGRTLDREIRGKQLRDLDGNGVPDDTEGTVNDTTPGSRTRVDYSLNTLTGLFDIAPSPKLRLRAGYRTIYRELERSGFEFGTTEYRNTNFESDRDDTIILGLVLDPVGWFHLNADYEEGDIAQPLSAASAMETDRLRVAARFRPRKDLRLDVSYLNYGRDNRDSDFRVSTNCGFAGGDVEDGCWNTNIEGTTYAGSLVRTGSKLDYWIRWARHETDSRVRARFDTDLFFNSAENGDSVYDNESNEWAGRVSFTWAEPWRAFVRVQVNDSDGNDSVFGPTFASNRVLDQDYSDVEGGVTYTFPSSLYVGGRLRVFDYDDANGRLDYDGEIFTMVAGLSF